MHDGVACSLGDASAVDALRSARLAGAILTDRAAGADRSITFAPAIGIVLLACPASPLAPPDADPLAPLLERIRGRDETALEALHHACAARLHATSRRLARRAEIADEAVSACFQQVWNRAGEFDARRATVVRWLHLIVRSRTLDLMRAARLRASHECDLGDDERVAGAAVDSEPCTSLEAAQSRQRLRRAMGLLTPIQRQVLSLTFLDGLTQREAADQIGLPLGTIKSHSRRGLDALRRNAGLRAASAATHA